VHLSAKFHAFTTEMYKVKLSCCTKNQNRCGSFVILACVVLTQYYSVTDVQTGASINDS